MTASEAKKIYENSETEKEKKENAVPSKVRLDDIFSEIKKAAIKGYKSINTWFTKGEAKFLSNPPYNYQLVENKDVSGRYTIKWG